ncbi:MAG: Foldase protein PrsA 1 precursor [Syntrophorhabdaceae bacterium PtaU1.Bin034]|nr:MAG: Foldase protein PrsA 1 precursor [Syntrophorhabdaceae bacterium PtaU1.Bin034]
MHTGKVLLVALCILSLAGSAVAADTAASIPPTEKTPNVVAVVNGAEVTLDDFNKQLYQAQRMVLDGGRLLTASHLARLRSDVLEGLVKYELLYLESKKTVKVTDADIAAEFDKMKGQFRSETDFQKVSLSLRPEVERTLSIRKYFDTYASKAEVTDEEIRSYYDANRNGFLEPEQVKASHIMVKVNPQGNEEKKTEAKKKIEDIRKKVLAGEDFASLARTSSEDITASRGGDMGYIRRGQLLKPVEDVLFALKAGEVSEVVETWIGYHLLKVAEHKPETTLSFEDVKDRVRTVLQQKKGQEEASAYMTGVREKAVVQTFPPPEE